jgi:1-acyl-sn-glycerol-3-phosphate acyltransferase
MTDEVEVPEPPSDGDIAVAARVIDVWRRVVEPSYQGLENVPDGGPMLFAGNHTVFGAQDVPVMMLDLYREKGLKVRALGDHNHFRVPVWGDLLTRVGAVDGTRATCRALMRRGEPILVFPGGAREVNKRAGEDYKLIWKKRYGFVRLAIEHGYPIVPFAALGGDDNFEVLIDIDSRVMQPLAAVLERVGGERAKEVVPPVAVGPHLQRFYFAFAEPIETLPYGDRHRDQRTLRKVRDKVSRAVERELQGLREVRDADDRPTGVARLARAISPGGG